MGHCLQQKDENIFLCEGFLRKHVSARSWTPDPKIVNNQHKDLRSGKGRMLVSGEISPSCPHGLPVSHSPNVPPKWWVISFTGTTIK